MFIKSGKASQSRGALPDRTERGQTIVLLALMLVGLIAAAGLALDGGQVYEWRRKMQNAADAGAYRGARELALYRADPANGYAGIYSKIQNYVIGDPTGRIGNEASDFIAQYLPSGVTIVPGTPPAAADNCVRVIAHRSFQPFVMTFLGFTTLDVSARATACSGALMAVTGLRPFAVLSQTFNYEDEYCLFDSAGTSGCVSSPGNFGWLDLDGGANSSNPNSTPSWLRNGFSGTYKTYSGSTCNGGASYSTSLVLPTCLELDTGMANSNPMRDAMSWLADTGTEIIIPLYDYIYGSGAGSQIHLVAFAKFVISSYSLQGNPKYIRGHFVGYVDIGQICTTPPCPGGSVSGTGVQLTD